MAAPPRRPLPCFPIKTGRGREERGDEERGRKNPRERTEEGGDREKEREEERKGERRENTEEEEEAAEEKTKKTEEREKENAEPLPATPLSAPLPVATSSSAIDDSHQCTFCKP